MKKIVIEFYKNLLTKSTKIDQRKLKGPLRNTPTLIDVDDNLMLTKLFSDDEICFSLF